MGHIKTSKLDNGMIGLEITYGGKEAPFGGCDFSAPPPYIDPNCFADASSFFVVDGQLVACGWFMLPITLSGWTSGMTYMDSGSFYQNKNYWNWALAYTSTSTPATSTAPAYTTTNYTIWTWQGLYPGSVPIAATASIVQNQPYYPAVPATAILQWVGPTASVSGGYVIALGTYSTPSYINVTVNFAIGDTAATIAAKAVTAINSATGNTYYTASAGTTSGQVVITMNAPGTAGNGTQIAYSIGVAPGTGPALSVLQQFTGGANAAPASFYGIPPNPVTWVCVGETLYVGGYGTMILQYTQSNGTPQLSLLTDYLGAICLGKFNSQLIAAGIVPGPGLVSQGFTPNTEMILAWSAPNELGVWNPTNANGTVTGAGFNQISDVSDYLTGTFLTPGTCIILRTQGIDYITPLSGGFSPFDFSHISNSFKGEGCQHFKLVSEYDQVGTFVGNTNVFQFSGSIIPIGDKIRNKLYTHPSPTTYHNRDSASGPYNELRALQVLSMFIMDDTIYIYDLNNKTWMIYYLVATSGPNVFDIEWLTRDVIPSDRPQEYCNSSPVLVTEDSTTSQPLFWRMQSYIQDVNFPHATECYVTFPQEEISFGRDITIESAYVSIAGTPGTKIEFWVSNLLHAELVLPSTSDPTLFANYQIWFVADPTLNDKTTIQSPQLSVSLPMTNIGANLSARISKIALFGSFDPAQRPV